MINYYVHAKGKAYGIVKATRHTGVDDRIKVEKRVDAGNFLAQQNNSLILLQDGGKIIYG